MVGPFSDRSVGRPHAGDSGDNCPPWLRAHRPSRQVVGSSPRGVRRFTTVVPPTSRSGSTRRRAPSASRARSRGEHSFPLILQNAHRFFMWVALVFIAFLAYACVSGLDGRHQLFAWCSLFAVMLSEDSRHSARWLTERP